VAIVLGAAATAALVFALQLAWWVTVVALVAVAGIAVRELWRCAGRGVPALVHVGDDRRLTVSDRNGRVADGDILDASYVGAWLATVVWRADRAPWWRLARTLLVLPDMLPAEDFRRLRVLLRYGVAKERADRSGAEAR
jgi:hypothetical protein